jgi:capsular polysaccharide biosynthesis protein
MLAGVAAVAVVYIIALIKSMFSRTIQSEDDIKELTAKYPLLSSVPVWE